MKSSLHAATVVARADGAPVITIVGMSTAYPDTATGQVGTRLRSLRKASGVSARALAERLGISPSAVSQIERGVMAPSVSRLIAITDALGIPLAAVFEEQADAAAEPAAHGFALQRGADRATVELENGVRFRRIAPGSTPGIDWFESDYPPGATAHAESELFRHQGYEVGTVVSGELTIDFTDERVVLRTGDTISYPCSRPHRIHNDGEVPAVAQWLIVHP